MKANSIYEKLNNIEQYLQQTEKHFSFNDASVYLNVSKSYLYKITHFKIIPFYKPNGKKIYFKKTDLDNWLFRNRIKSNDEIEQEAINYSSKVI